MVTTNDQVQRLQRLLYRFKMLIDEYDLRQIDYEAGPLLDEAERELDDAPPGQGRVDPRSAKLAVF